MWHDTYEPLNWMLCLRIRRYGDQAPGQLNDGLIDDVYLFKFYHLKKRKTKHYYTGLDFFLFTDATFNLYMKSLI